MNISFFTYVSVSADQLVLYTKAPESEIDAAVAITGTIPSFNISLPNSLIGFAPFLSSYIDHFTHFTKQT